MSEKLTKEEYLNLLQCVRCGSIEKLRPYKQGSYQQTSYKSTKRYTRTTGITYNNEFPVCETCIDKFKNYSNKRGKSLCSLIIGIFIIWYAVIAIFFSLNNPPFLTFTMIVFFIALSLIVIGGAIYGINKKSLDNPENYMDVSLGVARIKPENSEKWFPFKIWADLISKNRLTQGNINRNLLLKVSRIVETNVQKEVQEQARISSIVPCPNCGNLNDVSKRSDCEICGSKYNI